jgi:hypothetical protein
MSQPGQFVMYDITILMLGMCIYNRLESNVVQQSIVLKEEYDEPGGHSDRGNEPGDDTPQPGHISDSGVGQIANGRGRARDPSRRSRRAHAQGRRACHGGSRGGGRSADTLGDLAAERGIDRVVAAVNVEVVDLEL